MPVAVRCKAWVGGRSQAGIVGSNPAGGMDVLSVVSVVCCQVEGCVSGRSVKANSYMSCGAHAVPLPRHAALIHTCHAAPLPFSDSAVSFLKVRVVAGNIRTPSPTV
jgi:hypothetical protein